MIDMTFKTEGTNLMLEGVFNAPRDVVWDAWTNSEKLAQWWGPRGWQTTNVQFEFVEGGTWHYCMKCMDESQGEWFGQESWGLATFKEIQPKDKFVYEDAFSDAGDDKNQEMPIMTITMLFEETEDGKTRVKSHTDLGSEEALQKLLETGMEQGTKETWDRLAEMVENS